VVDPAFDDPTKADPAKADPSKDDSTAEHLPGYQARDYEVVDYELYPLDGTRLQFRGPQPKLSDGEYFSCLGAAQTFGCFTPHPYPALLEKQTGAAALNLGYGGAGPRFYNRHPELIEIVNRGQLAVVQIMSGRSEDNSRFESRGLELLTRRRDGKPMSADAAWRSVLEARYLWRRVPVGQQLARHLCQMYGARDAKQLLRETRAEWIASYRTLLDSIRVPTVLLWFSQRTPDFQDSYENLHRFMGLYPQLVTRDMVEIVAAQADEYVECTTERGSPQQLRSRFDGSPVVIELIPDPPEFAGQTWTENRYYPSTEMHEDAAASLLPVLSSRLRG